MTTPPISKIALLGLLIGVGAISGAMLAGFGTRAGWWGYRTGFGILGPAAWTGLGGAAVALIGCFMASRPGRRGLSYAAVGLVAGLLAYAVPASGVTKARTVPKIHDITTDTVNPPAFVAALEARKLAGATNKAVYAGAAIASQQRKAYPDLQPVKRAEAPDRLFDRALATSRALGWTILATDKPSGRIEATDRTLWFGFTDDIVIRVAVDGAGASRLDIRSVSRVGRSDAGTNAARIRRFIAAIEAP